jgi:hypothetical protein
VAANRSLARQPRDLTLVLDLTIPQVSALTNLGRTTIVERIRDQTYRAKRGPRGEYLIARESVLAAREREYEHADLTPKPVHPPAPGKRPRGRPRKA